MKTAVNNYIGSLNWGYRVALKDKNVNYVNAYAEFVEPHKIKVSRREAEGLPGSVCKPAPALKLLNPFTLSVDGLRLP